MLFLSHSSLTDYVTGVPRGDKALGYVSAKTSHLSIVPLITVSLVHLFVQCFIFLREGDLIILKNKYWQIFEHDMQLPRSILTPCYYVIRRVFSAPTSLRAARNQNGERPWYTHTHSVMFFRVCSVFLQLMFSLLLMFQVNIFNGLNMESMVNFTGSQVRCLAGWTTMNVFFIAEHYLLIWLL